MKTKSLLLLVAALLVGTLVSRAQDSRPSSYKYNNYFDLGASFASSEFVGSLGWSHLYTPGKKKKFAIGYGIRYTGYWGANKQYRTAPAKYTSTKQNLFTILSDDIPENIDTLSIVSPQVNSLNLGLHLQYAVLPKLELGTNIDLVGFSFGSSKRTFVQSSALDEGQPPVINASPTKLNLLLTSDNDIGSLNSEFYARYWVHKKWAVKAGYTFYFSEYTTDQKLSFDNGRVQNDRYRLKSGLLLLGITFTPFAR